MYEKEISGIVERDRKKLGILSTIKSMRISELGRGENNLSMLIVVNRQQKFVFRIGMREGKECAKVMRHSFHFLNEVPRGLAPTPYMLDISKKRIPRDFCILSFIEGNVKRKWTRRDLALHACALARLHRKRYPAWSIDDKHGRTLDMEEKFEWHMKHFKDVLKDEKVKLLLPEVRAFIKKNNRLFTSLRMFSMIHRDSCADNVIFSKDAVRYIDWEWAGIRDNAEDLTSFYCETAAIPPWYIKLKKEDVDFFLDTYLRHHPDRTLKERVRVLYPLRIFMDYVYVKWVLMQKGQKGNFNRPRSFYARTARTMEKFLFHSFSR